MALPPPATSEQEVHPAAYGALPGAWLALTLLFVINFFNYIDRQLLIAVLPKISETLEAEDPSFATDPDNAKKKLGALSAAFMICFLITSQLVGRVAQSSNRWILMGAGVILWSLASGATGLANGFLLLVLTRCLSGIGEGAYGPTAPAMLSDLFPLAARGRVLGLFYAAIPLGVAAGYLFGGYMADSVLGWQWAFYIVLPPGILLGLLCSLMPEPPRKVQGQVVLHHYLVLARTPSYVLNTLGMTAMMFASGGIGAWMNTYLYEREGSFIWSEQAATRLSENGQPLPEQVAGRLASLADQEFPTARHFKNALRTQLDNQEMVRHQNQLLQAARRGPSLGYINTNCGLMGLTGGFLGTLLGSFFADRLRARFQGAYFLLSGWALILSLPVFLCILITPMPYTWFFVFLTTFCLFLSIGPTSAILANVAHPSMRATAFAVNLFFIHALGDAISPFLIGAIADEYNLQAGFFVVSLILLLGGILWLWGARFLQRDTELAPFRLEPTDKAGA